MKTTPKINDFTSLKNSDYNVIREKINQALKSIGAEYGIEFKAKGVNVSQAFAHFKLEMVIVNADGTKTSPEADAFVKYASMFGLKADDLNKKFKHGSQVMQIIGLKPNASKNPVIVTDGVKRYVMPATPVKSLLLTHPA